MQVSNWPKRPNMVPRPNLGGESTFLRHDPLGQGVLSFAPIAAPCKYKEQILCKIHLSYNGPNKGTKDFM